MQDALENLEEKDVAEIRAQTQIIASAKDRRIRILADKGVDDAMVIVVLSWWDDLRHLSKEDRIRTLKDIMPMNETFIRDIVDKLRLE
jgi:hypothetical protein